MPYIYNGNYHLIQFSKDRPPKIIFFLIIGMLRRMQFFKIIHVNGVSIFCPYLALRTKPCKLPDTANIISLPVFSIPPLAVYFHILIGSAIHTVQIQGCLLLQLTLMKHFTLIPNYSYTIFVHRYHSYAWCAIRDLNPDKIGFEPIPSASCGNRASYWSCLLDSNQGLPVYQTGALYQLN